MFVVVGVLFRNGSRGLGLLFIVRQVQGGVRGLRSVTWLRLLLAVWRRLPSSTGVRSRPERFDRRNYACRLRRAETCGASAATKFRPLRSVEALRADGRRPRLIGVYCGPLFHFGGNSSPPVRLSCWIKVGAVSLLSTHTVLPPWSEAHTESRGESADCNPVDAPELKAVCRKSLSIRCARRRCFFRGASIQAARGHARVESVLNVARVLLSWHVPVACR